MGALETPPGPNRIWQLGWSLRRGARRRELTIGRYSDIGLAEARGLATLKRAEVQQGRNPAAEKRKAKATAARDWTVRDLAKDYRAKKLESLAHSTQLSYGRQLQRVEKKLRTLAGGSACALPAQCPRQLVDSWPSLRVHGLAALSIPNGLVFHRRTRPD